MLAGALGLALACDLIIASEGARFGTPEINVGVFPFMIMALIYRNVPRKKTTELLLLGEQISAEEAERIGIVNRVVRRRRVRRRASTSGRRSWPPSRRLLMKLGKDAMFRQQDMAFADALDFLRAQLTIAFSTEDIQEGVRAFFEKREPRVEGPLSRGSDWAAVPQRRAGRAADARHGVMSRSRRAGTRRPRGRVATVHGQRHDQDGRPLVREGSADSRSCAESSAPSADGASLTACGDSRAAAVRWPPGTCGYPSGDRRVAVGLSDAHDLRPTLVVTALTARGLATARVGRLAACPRAERPSALSHRSDPPVGRARRLPSACTVCRTIGDRGECHIVSCASSPGVIARSRPACPVHGDHALALIAPQATGRD